MQTKKLNQFLFTVALAIVSVLGLCSWISSEEYYHSKENASTDFVCDRCDGNGHDPVLKCRTCKGSGTVVERITCPTCLGDGIITDKYGKNHTCYGCHGEKTTTVKQYCSVCDGWGSPNCTKCKGSGRVTRN